MDDESRDPWNLVEARTCVRVGVEVVDLLEDILADARACRCRRRATTTLLRRHH